MQVTTYWGLLILIAVFIAGTSFYIGACLGIYLAQHNPKE